MGSSEMPWVEKYQVADVVGNQDAISKLQVIAREGKKEMGSSMAGVFIYYFQETGQKWGLQIMLRKVKRDQSKGELILDHCSNVTQKHKSTSFFRIPSLFVGFTQSVSDCDSVRSPTSPFDAIIFSSFGCSLWSQKTKPDSFQSQRKSWCSEGIGLGIVGSLTDVKTLQAENCAGKSDTKNILFGSQLNNSASYLPQLNMGLHGFPTSSNCSIRCALSTSEIELCEDYTCDNSWPKSEDKTYLWRLYLRGELYV